MIVSLHYYVIYIDKCFKVMVWLKDYELYDNICMCFGWFTMHLFKENCRLGLMFLSTEN